MTPSTLARFREPVDPARVRTIPAHFAWADHRLREWLAVLSHEEGALLFFLILAADANGCSFWSDRALARKLNLREGEVIQARYGLVHHGLILYRYPLYQLLEVPPLPPEGRP
jgi:hypothetical protein